PNALVLHDVPAGARVLGPASQPIDMEKAPEPIHAVTANDPAPQPAPEFLPYGTPCDETPDPVACKLDKLGAEMAALRNRVAELERDLEAARAPALDRRQA
ncbi:MAG: hypothetical protein ACREFD_00910, partial [Stellaceae bacterium]